MADEAPERDSEAGYPLDQVAIGLLTTFIAAPIRKTGFDVMHASDFFNAQWWGGVRDLGLVS